jgi:tetratricopeptide (TPR) repeat protein
MNKKVLLVGWDAADWKVITPLMDSGLMPNLEKLVSEGVMGNLATLYPILSPMLWTSVATGKRAHKHGIHGFAEPDPHTGAVRPITNLGRKTKAVWNILNQQGLRSHVVGWWPSQPAEPINGAMVSNLFQQAPGQLGRPWPMRPGTVHPPRLAEVLAECRIHPGELDGDQLLPFVPRAAEIDQEKDPRLGNIAKVLAENAGIHAAATALMQMEPWDFMAVYYDGIDHFSHGFMKYHPPRLDWIDEDDFELYKAVVNTAYRYHDLMLGTLMHLAGEDAAVIVCSDHGFHPDHLRPKELPNEPAGPAAEHRHFGMFAMKGPGIKRDELVFGATLLDITPTILSLYGLPMGRDMDGKPLLSAFEAAPEPAAIDSWDAVPGDAGTHLDADKRVDAGDAQEAIRQLVELGYMDPPNADQEMAVAQTVRELRYNLARDCIDCGKQREALPILEQLWEAFPDESRFGVSLLQSLLALGRTQEAEAALERLVREKQRYAAEAAAELTALGEAWKARKPEELTSEEQQRLNKLRKRAGVNFHAFAWLRGQLLDAQGKPEQALLVLAEAETVQTHNLPSLYQKQGEILLKLRRWREAEERFQKMLAIDPVNPQPHAGLCRCHLSRREWQQALDIATTSLGLLYHQPRLHYYCGFALANLSRDREAAGAYQTALEQAPLFVAAHRQLARLYRRKLELGLAVKHRQLAREAVQQRKALADNENAAADPGEAAFNLQALATLGELEHALPAYGPLPENAVVIVSGLPRSGTSMMMQMLAAGGVKVLADETRQADEDNPRGYYEWEAVRKLRQDSSWLDRANGKAVKLVAQLLPYLPQNRPYRIIFMERPLGEIVASQEAMLQRLDRTGGNLTAARLARTFMGQLQSVRRVLNRPEARINVLGMDYHQALHDPLLAAVKLNAFLGGGLDEQAMAAAIVPALRRQGRLSPDEQ